MKRTWLIRIGAGLVVLMVALWMTAGYLGARIGTQPHHGNVNIPRDFPCQPVQEVSIPSADGITLSAWYIPKKDDRAVILLSGIGNCRRQMIPNAEVYAQMGYTVLMPDLRGTGKSGGDLISIGWHERKDLEACVRYLESLGYKHIGASGFSLGAATIAYSFLEQPNLAFVVLESCYDTMQHAVDDRLDLYKIPHFVAWPMNLFGCLRVGASMRQLQPMECMRQCNVPALIVSGDSEGFLKESETRDIFDRCASSKKRLHIFKGGHHDLSVRQFQEEFKTELNAFLRDVETSWATS